MGILEIYFYVLIMGLNLSIGVKCLVDYCKSDTIKSNAVNLILSTINLGAFLLMLFGSLIPAVL
jgi:hypothetical protein